MLEDGCWRVRYTIVYTLLLKVFKGTLISQKWLRFWLYSNWSTHCSPPISKPVYNEFIPFLFQTSLDNKYNQRFYIGFTPLREELVNHSEIRNYLCDWTSLFSMTIQHNLEIGQYYSTWLGSLESVHGTSVWKVNTQNNPTHWTQGDKKKNFQKPTLTCLFPIDCI